MNRFPLILSALAGFASATGFAPLGAWPVTLAAFALLLHLVAQSPSLKSALLRGWLFGVGHFTLGLNWIAHAFTYQDAMPHWFGYGAVVLLAVYLAVYPAMAAGLAWRWGRNPLPSGERATREASGERGLPFVVFFAAAWIVTEWLRATMFTGFAWNPLGVATVPIGALPVVASGVGTYGLSGLVVLAAGALWVLTQRRWAFTALILAPMALLAIFPKEIPVTPTANEPVPPLIRIVQPNIGQQDKHKPEFEAANFRKLATLTGEPTAIPRLILWPEAAVPDYLDEEPIARVRIARLLGPRDILLTGATKRYRMREREGDFIVESTIGGRNAMYAIDARGDLLHRYDKAHLVPYGEYLPMRPILSAIGFSRLVPGDIDFWAGPGPQSYALPGFGKVGVQICYEIVFSGEVVDRNNRPDFLFNPSNDAWFGSWGPPQHLAQARLRAIEEGLPVIRSTPTGISAVIDANGQVLKSLPHQSAGFIDARLPAPHAPTLFARYGNLLPMLFALLLTGLGVAMRRRAR